LAFGLQLPVQAQSPLFAEPWEAEAGVAEMVAVAQACDSAGFAYVAVCDHIAVPGDRADAMGTTWWDPVATLAHLAAVTRQVRLLSHVYVLPYRHPLAAAKAWATLDALSEGRAILGVGAGHVEGEFEALGVAFADRGHLLDEAIDAVSAALAGGSVSHRGERWSFDAVAQRPRPVQAHLPIWVGGSSPVAMRRAACRGDGWLPQGPPPEGMAVAVERVRALRADSERAGDPLVIGALSGPLHVGEARPEGRRCVHGPADTIAGYLRGFAEIGVDQVQVAFASRSAGELCEQIGLFASDVMPLVRG
jgi:probable F420-dependent oxidoreductase